ncbi:MAG: phosphoglycerate mutase family protein [Cyanobacteria bacterium REEB67]|nr:phosphoglycerate mutase family protein [Cyanobacteria bacterium REEB67]
MSEPCEKFYFVRHGETDANANNLAAGSGWDIELNSVGLAQAQALAASERLGMCKDVMTICVSPMTRALQTAEAINQVLQAPLVVIEQLKEWQLGDWERVSWSELPSLYHPDSNPPNGETQIQFGTRVAGGLSAALGQAGPILIVAHGGVWHAISRILTLPHASIGNCDLIRVQRASAADPWILD